MLVCMKQPKADCSKGFFGQPIGGRHKKEVYVDERITISGVWREALTIIRRYPLATLVPPVVLAALGDAPYYFLKDSGFGWEQILTFITSAFAYYFYVAYAEEIAVEAERGTDRITVRGMLRELQ